MKHLLIIAGFLWSFTLFSQVPVHHNQSFTLQNVKIDPVVFEQGNKVIRVVFDCRFGRTIEDISKARYKFFVVLKKGGTIIYQNPRNNISGMATEVNIEKAKNGQAYPTVKDLELDIPYKEIPLSIGEHPIDFAVYAQSYEYEKPKVFPEIFSKKINLSIQASQNIPVQNQEFNIVDIRMENEEILGIRGAKIWVDLASKYAYYDFENPKNISDNGTFRVYMYFKDSTGHLVYSPKPSRVEHYFKRLKPAPNARRKDSLVTTLDFFVPYHRVDLPSGVMYPAIELLATSVDSVHRFHLPVKNRLLMVKPFTYPYDQQTFRADTLEMRFRKGQEQKYWEVKVSGEFKFAGQDVLGSDEDTDLRYFCLHAHIADTSGNSLYQPLPVPKEYRDTPWNYLISKPLKGKRYISGKFWIADEQLPLEPGTHTVQFDLYATDFSGKKYFILLKSETLRIVKK